MRRPDEYVVGLLSFGMMAVAFVTIFSLTIVARLKSHRFLPARNSRSIYSIGMALMVPRFSCP